MLRFKKSSVVNTLSFLDFIKINFVEYAYLYQEADRLQDADLDW